MELRLKAVAFVATVYGVGVANLILLPMGKKIIVKSGEEKERKTVIAEGVLSIQEGLNPRILEEKLKLTNNSKENQIHCFKE